MGIILILVLMLLLALAIGLFFARFDRLRKALGILVLAVGVLFIFSGYGAILSFFFIPIGIVLLIIN